MPVATASDRLAIEHQKAVAGVAGGVASAVISTAMGADPVAISTWFYAALDGLLARIQAGYALNRRSALGYLPQHGALNRVSVSPVPGSLDIGSSKARLNITGPVAFKNAISAGFGQQQALQSMATQMGGVADELVRNGDRDVIMQTIRHGRGIIAYRRRLAGKSCGFCAMIASRGAVYTAETSTFRTHPHCRCWAEPLYRHEREPAEVQRLQRQWRRVTAGKSGTSAQRAWRQHWEQRATPKARAREGIRELIPAPVAAQTDPALKLTLAQLKQIARDNGVNITGARLKGDVLGRLRNHEDLNRVKLAGLPEFRAPLPSRVSTLTIDAPPLGVPAQQPVLSGSSLNNWADNFKYDRQYGRNVYVDANGNTPPEGIRVHNLRANLQGSFDTGLNEYIVKDGTAFSFDGVAYLIEHPPDQFGSPWVSKTLADLRRAHEDIPAAKLANKSYATLAGENPADPFWRAEYNDPFHESAAMAANGNLTLWRFSGPATPGGTYSRVNYDVLRHESGHNVDDLIGRKTRGSKSAEWDAATKSDVNAARKISDLAEETRGHGDIAKFDRARDFPNGVTSYGRSSVLEDYAESVRLYQEGVIGQGRLIPGAEKGPIYFRDLFPARAKILDDVFPDFARAQKAEIAALRAPKPAAADPLGRGRLSSDATTREVQIENRVRDAYNDLPARPGGYVMLSDLRDHPSLSRLSREEVDAALLRGNSKGMQLSTFDNTRALKDRDRLAALDIGGNPRHMISYRGPDRGAGAPLLKLPPPADFSKLKVPELRALAKERGVTGYSKLTKPQLLEELGGEIAPKPSAYESAISKAVKEQDALAAAGADATEGRIALKLDAGWTHKQERERYEAISAYRRNSQAINDYLRTGKGSPEVAGQVELIDDVLAKSPLTRDAELWRGVQAFDDSMTARLAAGQDLVGYEWTDKALTSTTARRRFAETVGNGLKFNGKPGIVMRILAPKGIGSAQLSRATYEAEVLLPRGLRFRVVKDYGLEPPRQAGVGLGFRRIDVEIVPTAAKRGAAETPGDVLVKAARERQADIDYARARAELLSEAEEWLNNQGTLASMAVQLRRDALRYGIEGHKDMAALFRAIDSGDEKKVRKAIETVAGKQKLTRVEKAGEVVKFDRALHGDIGKDLKPGEFAVVVRPGYTFERNGEIIRLHKAKVEKATAQEIAVATRAKTTAELARMTVAQLRSVASERGIDIAARLTKKDILAILIGPDSG